jgi:hypothetical protein
MFNFELIVFLILNQDNIKWSFHKLITKCQNMMNLQRL